MGDKLAIIPDWVSTTEENKEIYYKFSGLIQEKRVARAFKINTIGLYVYVIGYLLYTLTGETLMAGVEISVGVVLLMVSTIYILYKFNRAGLSLYRYSELYSMLPTLSKIFMIVGFTFIFATASSFIVMEHPIALTFDEVMFSFLPVLIAVIAITVIYPLTRYRRNVQLKKNDIDTEDIIRSEDSVSQDLTNEPHPILEAISSQNTHPLALTYDQLGFLQEHDLVEEYFETYEDPQN